MDVKNENKIETFVLSKYNFLLFSFLFQICMMHPELGGDLSKYANLAVDSIARFSKRVPGFAALNSYDQRTLVEVHRYCSHVVIKHNTVF